MEKILALLFSVLLLTASACAAQPQPVEPPTELPAVQFTQPAPTEPPTEPPTEAPTLPEWEGSAWQQGDPIAPQPGDTAQPWDAVKADTF
ncbi:MAG: hypothetical protein IKU58_05805, partial [Clostridia bacterium]|nr:hypothetical protein [Clostridia bacterium]